jgi:hypothetical protein
MLRRTKAIGIALVLVFVAAPASGLNRVPQIPISGTGLQQLLSGLGQTINVNTDQQFLPAFAGIGVTQPSVSFTARIKAGDATLALYNANEATSPLFAVFPSGAPAGWYTVSGFNAQLATLHVFSFDINDVLQGQVVHGPSQMTIFSMNFAVSDDAYGDFFADDTKNPGGAAHLLAFKGTGANLFDLWIAAETDGDGDFDDALFLLEGMSAVPVERASWGALKQRFR